MDTWDYLNKSLSEWLDDFSDTEQPFEDVLVDITQDYLPRFERALHENSAQKMRVQ